MNLLCMTCGRESPIYAVPILPGVAPHCPHCGMATLAMNDPEDVEPPTAA